jgi:hypothetical protein
VDPNLEWWSQKSRSHESIVPGPWEVLELTLDRMETQKATCKIYVRSVWLAFNGHVIVQSTISKYLVNEVGLILMAAEKGETLW